jgi:uncharacterized lipoprotein YddW (UPF0748 family)
MLSVFISGASSEEAQHRGLFVSMLQEPPVLSGPAPVTQLLDFARNAHIGILFVQIYHANKAWFPSRLADSEWYEDNRKRLSEDPFAQLIEQAHRRGIQVHAWINLLSLGENRDAMIVKKYGRDILTTNLKKKRELEDYRIDGQYFLEPGDPRVRQELAGIIREIVNAYPQLDGLQFDYIRYPDIDPHYGYSAMNMRRFKQASGLHTILDQSPAWKKWKRDQVTQLLTLLANEARQLRPNIQISTTGCLPYVRAYEEAFQDWPSWLSRGLVDFVTVMDYSPRPLEFSGWIEDVKKRVRDFKRVKIGVGAYRFAASPAGFLQEFRRCEQQKADCVIFHYGSLQDHPALRGVLTD